MSAGFPGPAGTGPDSIAPRDENVPRGWDDVDGEYWAANADAFDATLEPYVDAFFDAAALNPGERVLDIGCGCGWTTIEAARRTSPGRAVGLDLSAPMLEVGRGRAAAAGVAGVEFVHGDAEQYPFELGGFDVVISRLGVMFFADPAAAFANIGRALRPGGRVMFMVWQRPQDNEWIRVIGQALATVRPPTPPTPGAPGPFALAEEDLVRSLLTGAGLVEVGLTGVQRPIGFGADLDSAYDFLSGQPILQAMTKELHASARDAALAALRAAIEAHVSPDGLWLDSAAWLVTARRDL